MLQLSGTLLNHNVISLQTGGPIANAHSFIIDPRSLKIVGFYCRNKFTDHDLVLLTQDIRQSSAQGFWINSNEGLTEPKDLARLQEILQLRFQLPDKTVVTKDGKKVGRVNDFAVESESLYIQKLYVGKSMFKSLGGQLSIDRNQIVEITPKQIIIKELLKTEPIAAPNAMPAG